MNKKKLDTNMGTKVITWSDNGKGHITPSAITAFTRGFCHDFAYAMNEMTDWPIIGIGGEEDCPGHYVCYSPHIDDFVDIQGPGALERWPVLVKRLIREWKPDEYPVMYRPLDRTIGKPFAQTILDTVMSMPAKRTHKGLEKFKQIA